MKRLNKKILFYFAFGCNPAVWNVNYYDYSIKKT